MKLKISIAMTLIILFTVTFSSNAKAYIFNQRISDQGVKTYYVSSEQDNRILLNLLISRMDSEADVIYSGEMLPTSDIDPQVYYMKDLQELNYTYQSCVIPFSYKIAMLSSYSIDPSNCKDGTVLVKYKFTYFETADEAKTISDRMNKDIADNAKLFTNDYQKAYWAYHWVLDNVCYSHDFENISAYSGLTEEGTVCGGYSALYCALATKLGLECRCINGSAGTSSIDDHTWNLVKLDGKWYCVDTTWGDYYAPEMYFLKSKETLANKSYGNHKSKAYDNYIAAGEIFSNTDYIRSDNSEGSYLLPSAYNIQMDALKNNTLKVKETYHFMLNNENSVPIYFKSDNEVVAKVDKKGVITAKYNGQAMITAYNDDLSIKQECVITVIGNNKKSIFGVSLSK
jgi:Uncharacterized protein involved in cytokinesis, contains TGc (transglutaminase/protease-like) domain